MNSSFNSSSFHNHNNHAAAPSPPALSFPRRKHIIDSSSNVADDSFDAEDNNPNASSPDGESSDEEFKLIPAQRPNQSAVDTFNHISSQISAVTTEATPAHQRIRVRLLLLFSGVMLYCMVLIKVKNMLRTHVYGA
jgi:hypothetical protein